MLQLVSLNIALPEMVNLGNGSKKYRSGIFKKPITEKIFLDELGFHGDGVGDTRNHGGKDLAVCAYFAEHLSFWECELDRKILIGKIIIISMNITVSAIAIWGLYCRELDYMHIVSFTAIGLAWGIFYCSLSR